MNAAAVDVEFTEEDDEQLRKAIGEIGGPKGGRYPAGVLSFCFGDSPELAST
jgi:hypothetical protein